MNNINLNDGLHTMEKAFHLLPIGAYFVCKEDNKIYKKVHYRRSDADVAICFSDNKIVDVHPNKIVNRFNIEDEKIDEEINNILKDVNKKLKSLKIFSSLSVGDFFITKDNIDSRNFDDIMIKTSEVAVVFNSIIVKSGSQYLCPENAVVYRLDANIDLSLN